MKLRFVDEGQEREIPLDPGTSVVVGRAADCEIRVKTRSVSQHHVRIDVGESRCLWRDLGSRNGCFVGEERAEEGELRPGDGLRVGLIEMSLDEGTAPGGAAPLVSASAAAQDSVTPPPERTEGAEGEETPLDLSFVPAPRSRSVGAPAAREETGGAHRRRLLLWGVIAVLLIALAALLLMPGDSDGPSPEAEAPRPVYALETYENAVQEGIRHFRQEDYAAAAEIWTAADTAWRAAHPSDPRPVAAVFTEVAETFRAFREGGNPRVSWVDITENVLDLVNRGYVSGMALESFVEDLQQRFRTERRNEEALRQAQSAIDRGEYTEAIDSCRRIPDESLLVEAREECLRTAEEKLVEARVANAEEAARAGAWDLAVQRMENALLVRDDPEMRSRLETWRENRALDARIDTARRLLAGTRTPEINRAISMLEALPVRTPVTSEVPDLLEQARGRLFFLRAQAAFAAADAETLNALAEEPEAVSPQAAPIFATFRRVQRAMEAAGAALEAENYGEARERWEEVLLLVPEPENVFHVRAVGSLEEWSPSRIGRIRLEDAEQAIREEEFGRAREYLRQAREIAQIDTSELEETLERFGKRLYTTAVNTIINNPSPAARAEAREKLEKALLCFDPTDEMYMTVKERLDKEFE